MSGLALIAQALGAQVTGSDRAESSYTERLREHGIEPVIGHARRERPRRRRGRVLDRGRRRATPSARRARGRELHRAELLAEIAALRRCLAVTGTHGKTTTAGMVVHALRGCGLDPAYVLGGELRGTGLERRLGQRASGSSSRPTSPTARC